MATNNSTFWATSSADAAVPSITNAATDITISNIALTGSASWNSSVITQDSIVDAETYYREGTLKLDVGGESVDVSKKLTETEMLLGVMTTLLDTLIKANPEITSAKSIEELIDQHKMMKKLST